MGETKEGEGEKSKPPVDHGPEVARAHQRLDEIEKRKHHEHGAEHQDHKHEPEQPGDKTTIGRRPEAKGKEGESSSSSSTPSAGASIIGCSGVLAMVAAVLIVGAIAIAAVLS